MTSTLNAAEDAAIVTLPRLFIADWTTMFESENTAPCMPAGTPILSMRQSIFQSMRRFLNSTWIKSSLLKSLRRRTTELTTFASTVAIATPSTVLLRTMTKNRLSITFRTPESASAISGVFVSPALRNMAASKL